MTSDAELLAGATVATRARHRVDARLHAVLTATGARGDPPRRVGTPGCGTGGNPLRGVAIEARRLAVARHTQAGIGARFLGMPRAKPSAVKARETRLVKGKRRGQSGDRVAAVAGCARALAVAARAKIASAGGPHAVLTNEVRVVHQVVVGHRSFVRERNVTAVTIAQAPLVLVLVTAKAARHLRQDRLRVPLGDLDVTSNAVAPGCRHVLAVLETQMLARELDSLAHV